MKLRKHTIFLLDTLLIFISFYLSLAFKQDTIFPVFNNYINSFLLFIAIWILISLSVKKYSPPKEKGYFVKPLTKIILTSGITLGIISTLMYFTRVAHYSRMIVFGTLAISTIVETGFCIVFFWIRTATKIESLKPKQLPKVPPNNILTTRLVNDKKEIKSLLNDEALKHRQETLLKELAPDAFNFIFKYVPLDSFKTFVVKTTSHLNIKLLSFNVIDSVVNLKRVNDIRYINKFFESVNTRLPNGGIFVGFLETKNQRKARLLKKFPPIINYIYYFFDFIIKRTFPKFTFTKKIYFLITRGQNRVLTKAEAFGRLYSCGFDVIDEMENNGYLYFAALKTKEPLFPEKPTYGPLIRLERVGKEGKIIKVYKLRTMHPYSEFLQDYVYRKVGLQEGGKFKSDFRVSTLGKFFRIFWIDELPMIINLLRRDMKIVGVRPLSRHYFSLYSKEHQQRRINYTPGLVPPFYVDNPRTLDEIIESEKRYLDAYDKHPIRTDLKYFFKAFYNIIFKKLRSA